MDEKEFLKQLDKRLENVATKSDLEGLKSDFEKVKADMATKEDLKQFATKEDLGGVKLDLESLKLDVVEIKDDVKRANRRVDEVYNLADKIAKGIEEREQEFYSREAQVDRKLEVLGEKAGIDISKIE